MLPILEADSGPHEREQRGAIEAAPVALRGPPQFECYDEAHRVPLSAEPGQVLFHVADPNFAPMYATRTRRIKADRRDARALADANRLGAYRPARRLTDAQRQVRGRLGVREALVRTRSRCIAPIRALLRPIRRRAPLALDEREYKAARTSRDRPDPTVTGEP